MERFQDRQVLSKILQESILQMCKVSVGLHSNISIDGIVCIALQDDDREIIVKIHEQVNRGLEPLDMNRVQSTINPSTPATLPLPVTTSPCVSAKPTRLYVDPLHTSKQPELVRSSVQNQISKDYFLGDEHELFGDLAAIKAIMPLNSAEEASFNHAAMEDTINLIDDESIEFDDNFVDKPVCDLMNVKPDPGSVSSRTVANVVSSEQEVCAVTSVLETRPSIKKTFRSRLPFAQSPVEESSDDDLKIEKLKAGRIRRHKRIPSECSTRLSPTDMINFDALPFTIALQNPAIQAAKIRSHVNLDDPQVSIFDDSGDVDIKPILRQRQVDVAAKDPDIHSSLESFSNMSPHSSGDCQQQARVIAGSDDLDHGQQNTCLGTVSSAAYTTITPNIKTQTETSVPSSYNDIFPNDTAETDAVITSYTNITPSREATKSTFSSNMDPASTADVSVVPSYTNISPQKKKLKTDVRPSKVSIKKLISFKSTGVTVAKQLHLLREQRLVLPDQAGSEVPVEDIKMDEVPPNFSKQYKCPICGTCQDVFKKHYMHMYQKHNVFPCPCCDKMFSHRYSRNRHIVSHHAGTKTFVCPFCNKKYVRADTLKLHIQKQHPDSMDQVKIHYSYAHSKQLYEPDSTEPSCSVTQDPDVVYNQNLPSKFETMEPDDKEDDATMHQESSMNDQDSLSPAGVSFNSYSTSDTNTCIVNTNTCDTNPATSNHYSTSNGNFVSRIINRTRIANHQNVCLVTENSNHSCSDNSNANEVGDNCIDKENIEDHARVVANRPLVVMSRGLTPDDDGDENSTSHEDIMHELEHDDIIDMIEISDEEASKWDS